MTVSRYFISTAGENEYFVKFKNLNLIKLYSILFGLFSLFSLFKLVEFKPNEAYSSFDTEFPYHSIDFKYCEYKQGEYLTSMMSFNCKVLPVLNLINNVLNNIVFFFISVVIDILMVRFARENIRRKMTNGIDARHLDEAIQFKVKINKMILTNGLVYFLSHIVDFVVTLLLLIFKQSFTQFCSSYFSCPQFLEISQSLNFLSISLNLFIFLLFDRNVLASFKNLFC